MNKLYNIEQYTQIINGFLNEWQKMVHQYAKSAPDEYNDNGETHNICTLTECREYTEVPATYYVKYLTLCMWSSIQHPKYR